MRASWRYQTGYLELGHIDFNFVHNKIITEGEVVSGGFMRISSYTRHVLKVNDELVFEESIAADKNDKTRGIWIGMGIEKERHGPVWVESRTFNEQGGEEHWGDVEIIKSAYAIFCEKYGSPNSLVMGFIK